MLNDITSTLEEFRPLLENRIASLFGGKRPGHDTSGCCAGASAALLKVLRAEYPEAQWKFTGGYGSDQKLSPDSATYLDLTMHPGGMLNRSGEWRGHFWIEGTLSSGQRVIVDITADQFGHEKLIVTDTDDPRYRKNLRSEYDEKDWIFGLERYFVDGLFADWEFQNRETHLNTWSR